jgi:translation initiation factor IF-2
MGVSGVLTAFRTSFKLARSKPFWNFILTLRLRLGSTLSRLRCRQWIYNHEGKLPKEQIQGERMTKIRVYELARDLNMSNKGLMDKLNDLDIAVTSHMSSLDEQTVTRIKSALFGPRPEAFEETRVKPTVIRRRRKPAPLEVTPEAPEEAEVPSEAETVPETETVVAEAAESNPQAEDTAPVEEAAIENVSETEAAAEQFEAVESAAPETPEARAAEQPATVDEPAATPAPEPKPVEELKPQKVSKKAKKKESAAKIIRLPVRPVERPAAKEPPRPEAAPVAKGPVPRPPRPVGTEEEQPAEIRKKKGKKRIEEPESDLTDRKFLKKKISFRKKEVIEGDELYEKGQRPLKTRKIAKGKAAVPSQKPQITIAKAIKRRIKVDDAIVLSDLAKRMGIKAAELIKTMMGMGVMATVNQTIDYDTAVVVAGEFNYEVERAAFEEETILKTETDDPSKLIERPPVVTIMGHVDHGKTSLLDVIRKSRITEIEAGGITQHIGAYHVSTEKGHIAFLDTPGHEAFTAMRARGAMVTDIVVLVVAADDGVMPQTVEAINHAKAARVPIIVAVNKIDKAEADPDKIKRQLAELGLSPEEWGGDTIFVNVSAKQQIGIQTLLEMILLQAEVLELRANPDKLAAGYVVEAKIDPGRGAAATVLVKDGTLRVGDAVVCGIHYGKIRAMLDDRGAQVESAGPSIPAEIIGLSGVPMAGDELIALSDEKGAKQVSLHRIQKQRAKDLAKTNRLSLEKLYERLQKGEVKELKLVIKADVHGSIEALVDSLTKLSNDEVKVNVIHAGTGTISESDVSLAAVSDAIIIGFNVRPNAKVQAMANEENVDMRFYNVIYNVINDVKNAMAGLMAPTFEERILGNAEVRDVFQVPKIGAVAGCYVTDGRLERGRLLRVIRDGIVYYEGRNSSLRRFKDDVREVQSGYECGVGIENYNDIKVGDVLQCYYLEEIKPTLD